MNSLIVYARMSSFASNNQLSIAAADVRVRKRSTFFRISIEKTTSSYRILTMNCFLKKTTTKNTNAICNGYGCFFVYSSHMVLTLLVMDASSKNETLNMHDQTVTCVNEPTVLFLTSHWSMMNRLTLLYSSIFSKKVSSDWTPSSRPPATTHTRQSIPIATDQTTTPSQLASLHNSLFLDWIKHPSVQDLFFRFCHVRACHTFQTKNRFLSYTHESQIGFFFPSFRHVIRSHTPCRVTQLVLCWFEKKKKKKFASIDHLYILQLSTSHLNQIRSDRLFLLIVMNCWRRRFIAVTEGWRPSVSPFFFSLHTLSSRSHNPIK